jgi:hypothetical protein
VSPSKHGHQQLLDDLLLANDDFRQFSGDLLVGFVQAVDCLQVVVGLSGGHELLQTRCANHQL